MQIKVKKALRTGEGRLDIDVDLQINEGSIIAVTGKSGSGKTTLLRIISGLTTPDEGKITFSKEIIYDSRERINVRTQNRNIGFVFQESALFPNMTVKKNILYSSNDPVLTGDILGMMELEDFSERKIEKLSGGQKQKVALARTFAYLAKAGKNKRGVLLLDEPLSAIDNGMRLRLQEEIIRFHSRYGMTIILVSHDAGEIFKLADRVVVMDNGKIINDGTPENVFLNKRTSHKFSFTGKLLDMKKVDVIYIALVGIGNNVCEVVLSEDDALGLTPGDSVLVASKAFNPVIKKISF